MTAARFVRTASFVAVMALAAACTVKRADWDNAKYWQRASVSEATYMEGPKAQQMLNRDIARCVTEIRELQRLGAIRTSLPGETLKPGRVPDPRTPRGELANWETPERDGALRAEYLDYHDFETCMVDKGWERVKNVPYDVAERARETYTTTILRQQYRSAPRFPVRKETSSTATRDDNYRGLNP